jgi:hypothetical protein
MAWSGVSLRGASGGLVWTSGLNMVRGVGADSGHEPSSFDIFSSASSASVHHQADRFAGCQTPCVCRRWSQSLQTVTVGTVPYESTTGRGSR